MTSIFLGHDKQTGQKIHLPKISFDTHWHLIGGTGKGKHRQGEQNSVQGNGGARASDQRAAPKRTGTNLVMRSTLGTLERLSVAAAPTIQGSGSGIQMPSRKFRWPEAKSDRIVGWYRSWRERP